MLPDTAAHAATPNPGQHRTRNIAAVLAVLPEILLVGLLTAYLPSDIAELMLSHFGAPDW